MLQELSLIIPMMEREFNGKSYNGTSLLTTLKGMDYTEIVKRIDDKEMTPWEIYQHVIFCKHIVLSTIKDGDTIALLPYMKSDFEPMPENTTIEGWNELFAFGEQVHELLLEALKSAEKADLLKEIEEWKTSVADTVAWLPGHDDYHNAQIRNAGYKVPKLSWD